MPIPLILFILVAAVGAVVLAAGVYERVFADNAAAAYLASLEAPEDVEDEFVLRLRQPLAERASAWFRGTAGPLLRRVTPSDMLAKARHNLLIGGLGDRVAPEEMVSAQVVLGAFGFLAALLFSTTGLSKGQTLLAVILLTTVGALVPSVIVKRKGADRSASMFKDLPDCLDLLAISVEAGVGFEAALDVVCSHFDSPLAEEFRRTLQEMELGVGRRDALVNMRNRTNLPELSSFIMALTQADALGMPIGRVLHTQAVEMRNRRRQWARERAAKLPVKIMFPLVFFIFPAILVVILFPSAGGIMEGLG